MDSQSKDELKRLMERVEELAASPANQRKLAHWQRYWAGVPSNQDPDGPLYTLDIGIPTWARILGFDVTDYFTDTATQLRCQLQMRIYHQEHFDDETPIGTGVGVGPLGTVLEPSLFGVEIIYAHDTNPWASHARAIVENEADLARLPLPDFYTAGAMPLAHRMYAESVELMQELSGGTWSVSFPAAIRGILGLAHCLRGPQENILVDLLDRPAFAHALFRYVTDFRKHYATERARFLGQPVGKGHIGNDEVTLPLISPRLYREFLLPYEIELSEFHGGLTCWHSCGDTTSLLPLIRRIPNIAQFYTGPWTDVGAVMATFGQDTPLDIAIHVVDDMLAASPQRMEAKLRALMATCAGTTLKIRAGSTDSAFGLQHDLEQMRTWTHVARRVTTSPDQEVPDLGAVAAAS